MKKLTLLMVALAAIVLAGCSATTIIKHQPSSDVPVEDALNTISRLVMTQHPKWRPDGIGVTEEFMYWGYGTSTRTTAGGMAIGIFGVGNARSTTRELGDRLYFADVEKMEISVWRKDWHLVTTYNRHGQPYHPYRSLHKEDAMAYVDALSSVKKAYDSGELKAFIEEREEQ